MSGVDLAIVLLNHKSYLDFNHLASLFSVQEWRTGLQCICIMSSYLFPVCDSSLVFPCLS